MRWQDKRRSNNVEDRRKMGSKTKAVGIGGLIIAAIMTYVTKDTSHLINAVSQTGQQSSGQQKQSSPQDNKIADFSSVILANLEDTWKPIFKESGLTFRAPKLVLFSDSVQSACGTNSSAVGPFYCPGDEKIYLDLSFLNELKKLGAPGDFAFAYVIGHEYGHHISNLLGYLPKVHQARRKLSKKDGNKLSVMLELQADCFAGTWAYYAKNKYNMLESGDIKEGLQAAAAIGDDKLMGHNHRPDLFTHGTSAQRMQWLKTGMDKGNVSACDTFKEYGIKL